jgi:hypothetical protein
MKMRALIKRAEALGVSEEALDEAGKNNDHGHAVICALILNAPADGAAPQEAVQDPGTASVVGPGPGPGPAESGIRKLQSATTCAPGTTSSYADETLGFRFRSEGVTADSDGPRWNAAVPPGLAFTMRRPVDQIADDNSEGFYSESNFTEPSLAPPPGVDAGVWFESASDATDLYDTMMVSNQKVAVGAANTFFAVVTPSSVLNSALHYNTLLGFRPNNAPGVFAWILGNQGCPNSHAGEVNENATGCMFVDDWSPSGFFGPPFQGGVTQIVIYRSRLAHNTLVRPRGSSVFHTYCLRFLGRNSPVMFLVLTPLNVDTRACTHRLRTWPFLR